MRTHRTTLVGRGREQEQLRELLAAACAASGRLVLLSGEAGIGKTTLVDDLIERARGDGVLVLSGGCYDLTTTPPYGPWSEAIRSYRPDAGQPEVPSWFGNLDELEKLGSQMAIFEQARQFFASIAEHQPLLIVLEDLHWADPASVDALRYLSRTLSESPVLILATYRDDEPNTNEALMASLPALVRESRAERLELRRWPESDTQTLISSRYRLGADDEARLASHTHRMAEGNPFFTVELLHELEGDATLRPRSGGWALGELAETQVPPLVRQVIERRLNRVGNETRYLLEIGAVIDYEVVFDLWQQVSETSESELALAVGEALSAQLVDELPNGNGLAFRHALIWETLYEGIVGLRRRSIHRQIAEALASSDSSDSDMVADHFLRALDARAVDWFIRAADRAENVYALMMAADRLDQAQRLLKDDPERVRDRGWLIYRIGRLIRSADTTRAFACFELAEELSKRCGERFLWVNCRYQAGFMRCWLGDFRGGIPLMLEASAALESPDLLDDTPSLGTGPYTKLTLGYTGHVVMLMSVGRFSEGLPLIEKRVEQLGHHGDLDLMLGGYHSIQGRIEPAREVFERGAAFHEANGHYSMVSQLWAQMLYQLMLPYFCDQVDVCQCVALKCRLASDQAEEGAWSANRPLVNQWHLEFHLGDWDAALQNARTILAESGYRAMDDFAASCLISIARHRGDFALAERYARDVLPEGPLTEPGGSWIFPSLEVVREAAAARLDADDHPGVLEWLRANDRWLKWSGAVLGQAEGHLLWARYHLVGGDRRRARERAEKALACASDPRQPLALIAVHRFIGELDTQERDYKAAGKHLEAVAKLAEACQAPYEIALTELSQAELAVALYDISQAKRLLERAQQTFERLGAKPALERAGRVATLLAMEARVYPAGLTAREVEVLCLVAEGLSNREIAERLCLSVRTVERHVTNIYGKIEVTNRVDAAAFAREHRLAELAGR